MALKVNEWMDGFENQLQNLGLYEELKNWCFDFDTTLIN